MRLNSLVRFNNTNVSVLYCLYMCIFLLNYINKIHKNCNCG